MSSCEGSANGGPTNERMCQERYRGRMADSITAVREALAKLQGEV